MITRIGQMELWSRSVICGPLVFISGQTANGCPQCTGISEQAVEVLKRIDEQLRLAGSARSNLVSVTIYLRDIGHFGAMNEIWKDWIIPGCLPARTTVQASLAKPDLLVEISAVAALIDQ